MRFATLMSFLFRQTNSITQTRWNPETLPDWTRTRLGYGTQTSKRIQSSWWTGRTSLTYKVRLPQDHVPSGKICCCYYTAHGGMACPRPTIHTFMICPALLDVHAWLSYDVILRSNAPRVAFGKTSVALGKASTAEVPRCQKL
jgi:hypothetical protein